MRFFALILGLTLFSLAISRAQSAEPASPPQAFFTASKVDGRWYLIDPQGNKFFSTGVTTVQFKQDWVHNHTDIFPYADACKAKYGTEEAWRKAIAARLMGWGFNTLGAWSDNLISQIDVGGKNMAYTATMGFGAGFVAEKAKGENAWLKGVFADVFDPDFVTYCNASALKGCASKKDDPHLIGYFTDNEMRWGPDWRGKDELLVVFLNLPMRTPGRDAALALLRQRYPDVAKFNEVWATHFASWDEAAQAPQFSTPPNATRQALSAQNAEVNRATGASAFISDCDAFLTLLADHYFKTVRDAIKVADPNHMVIGCRFAYVPAMPVVASAGKYMDVISANCYGYDPTQSIQAYATQDKPLIIGEFAFRGRDSGMPNTQGAGPLVDTQQQRAAAFAVYARAALAQPNLVGYQWFEHADEPMEGRFDGENSNYGLVDINDKPYDLLVQKMTEVNQQALALHEQGFAK